MGDRSFFSFGLLHVLLFLQVFIISTNFELVSALRDDWYGFASFADDEAYWEDTYKYTCDYSIDLLREPRTFSQRDNLRGRKENHSPIKITSTKTNISAENATLHIYSNPGIRNAHSVSYGFQRNKECLHGQDADCVVFPELGRVRAVVLNADRFSDSIHNLNYIKDHFLVEKPERFVTILNGGSIFERKFYEAVFLGGYSDNPVRSSHRIDGQSYPLEIYMFFLDETVPSVSLSTILVVLVEESDRDNEYIKPIINAIENKLYDEDRRFLAKNIGLIRRERLFHHLQGSTFYDVYDTRRHEHGGDHDSAGEVIFHEPIESSVESESTFTRYVEVFEQMQALEAEIFFLLEDHYQVNRSLQAYGRYIDDFFNRKVNDVFPSDFTEYQMMGLVALYRGYIKAEDPNFGTCKDFATKEIVDGEFWLDEHLAKFKNVSQVPTGAHLDAFVKLATKVCEHFDLRFTKPFNRNKNGKNMMDLSVKEKYEFIKQLKKERTERQKLNKEVWEHYHDKDQGGTGTAWHDYTDPANEKPNYAYSQQNKRIVDGIHDLLLLREKRENFKLVLAETEDEIEKIAQKVGYANEEQMNAVIRYLKFGSKHNDLKHTRQKVRSDFVNRQLPYQEKKRTLVELGGMEISEEKIKEYEELDPVRATVDEAFQISWLMPPDGGYYYYEGSSPIPPCFRAQNMVVFKRPISMSRRQIDILTRIPTSFDKSEDIRDTAPHLHDPKFEVEVSGYDTEKSRIEEVKLTVFNQMRNHLFLGHDGVHKNAVEEWAKIKLERKKALEGGANGIKPMTDKMMRILGMIIIVNFYF